MAHMIGKSDGVATGRGIVAWHGLGVTVPGIMNPAQAIEHAGLGWPVSLQSLQLRHPDFAGLASTLDGDRAAEARTVMATAAELAGVGTA